jgi:hypothetical protein
VSDFSIEAEKRAQIVAYTTGLQLFTAKCSVPSASSFERSSILFHVFAVFLCGHRKDGGLRISRSKFASIKLVVPSGTGSIDSAGRRLRQILKISCILCVILLTIFFELLREQTTYFLMSVKGTWSLVCHPWSKQQG